MRMAMPIYVLSAVTSAAVCWMLFQNYRRTGVRFLLWSSLCFAFFVVNNVILFFDMIVLPDNVDLSVIRTIPVVAGTMTLLYGFIWDST